MGKRIFAIVLAMTVLLTGCNINHKKIADKNRPGKHLAYYDTLTALYGSGKMDTLDNLGIGANDVDFVNENNNYIGIRKAETYAGVDLSIILYYVDSKLDGVHNRKTYAYPDELDQAVSDAMQIGQQLAKDLGKPHEVDTWNDWYEEEYQVEMDQETPAYQSAEQIKAFLDGNMGGTIMAWDMTEIACDAVMKQGERFNNTDYTFVHYILLEVSRYGDEITLQITY